MRKIKIDEFEKGKIWFISILVEIFLIAIFIFFAIFLLVRQGVGHKRLTDAGRLRYESYLLADQLRQSSDDLTRMVRTYVATSNEKFKQLFWDILDIRNGKKPKPLNYERVYWDFITVDNPVPPFNDDKKIALEEQMKQAGFTENEFELLAVSKLRSDKLVNLEKTAMNLMAKVISGKKENVPFEKQLVREKAIQILFGKEYHLAKESIMMPINEFYESIDKRTLQNILQIESQVSFYQFMINIVFALLVLSGIFLLFSIYQYHKNMIGNLSVAIKLKTKEITERKQVENKLLESEEKFRTLVTNSEEIIYLISKDGTFQLSEGKGLAKLGLIAGQVVGESVFELYKDYPDMLDAMKKSFLGETVTIEVNVSGNYFRNWYTPQINQKGETIGLMGLSINITEQKRADKQVKASLKEKEILLHEVHHRVKNNMQVINSLLKLQANNTKDEQIKNVLKESQSRVYAMSAVHETLHGSENLSKIDLKSYLSKITTVIFQTYSIDHRKVKLSSSVEDSPININQAYPLGLIINELISNSLKYAFPEDRNGDITVKLKKLGKEFKLSVKDNGIGMPEGFEWENSSTLGLKLVRTLVENQLDGSIDMESKNGTKFTVKFNIET